ncbi:MAG: hypothetical protein ACFE8N_11580 [Promethearchaeota archaeon]
MTELNINFKRIKFSRSWKSFTERYNYCNRCERHLRITNDEEIVCALCGETFCCNCISIHQQSCYCFSLN